MNALAISDGNKCKKILIFALLLFCAQSLAAQTSDREANLRSLVAAEQSFSRVSAAQGTREAFITFLADDGVIFNPLPANGKQIWTPRGRAPGVLTWTPVFADVSEAGDLGFTTGPYEFRRAPGEKPTGHGYYMSVWRKTADGTWKVLLDIGTRNALPETQPALEFPKISRKKTKKEIDAGQTLAALKAADEKFSQLLSGERGAGDELNEFVGDYLRLHRTNDFPLTEKNAGLAALQKYRRAIDSQTVSAGVARSGDFGYSYGTYTAKETGSSQFSESGSFARIWRCDESGKWKLTLAVMHAAPPGKRV